MGKVSVAAVSTKIMVNSMDMVLITFRQKDSQPFQSSKTQSLNPLPGCFFFFQPGNNLKVVKTLRIISFVEIMYFHV